MQNRTQRGMQLFILLVGGLVTLTFIIWPLYARRVLRPAREQDYQTARVREGTAFVVMKQDPPQGMPIMSTKPSLLKVLVRLNGKIYEAKNFVDYERLQEGHPAHIIYRVGRSGTVYVDTVRPLASTGP